MKEEASKDPENTSSQLSRKIAKGKKKEESYRLALSSQDVFSDSANPEGRQTKTSCPFANEQGNEAQLGKDRGEL